MSKKPCDEKHPPGDWHSHWVGNPKPCRICERDAYMRDCNGQPCHKVCADNEYANDRVLAQASPEPGPGTGRQP